MEWGWSNDAQTSARPSRSPSVRPSGWPSPSVWGEAQKHKSTKAEAELMSRPSARPSATHAHQLRLRLDTSTTSSREYWASPFNINQAAVTVKLRLFREIRLCFRNALREPENWVREPDNKFFKQRPKFLVGVKVLLPRFHLSSNYLTWGVLDSIFQEFALLESCLLLDLQNCCWESLLDLFPLCTNLVWHMCDV